MESEETEDGATENKEKKGPKMSSSLESSGVSSNMLLNLSQFIFIGIGALIIGLLLSILSLCLGSKRRKKVINKLNKIRKSFIWNGAIRSFLIAFINLVIAGVSGFILVCAVPNGEHGSTVASSSAMLLVCILFIIWSLIFVIKNRDNLDQEEYKKKYGNLWKGVSLHNKFKSRYTVTYIPMFMIRRFVFIFIPLATFGHSS